MAKKKPIPKKPAKPKLVSDAGGSTFESSCPRRLSEALAAEAARCDMSLQQLAPRARRREGIAR